MIQERIAAVFFILCIQFFACEQIVRLAWTLPYSFATNYVSDLGATACTVSACSPWHALMNSSFVLQGLLIIGGSALTWRQWSATGRLALALLQLCGVGVIVVGFMPENANQELHYLGAALHFLGGGLGILVAGFTFRRWFGLISVALGIAVLAATLELGQGGGTLVEHIGTGALERVAAYGIAGWMVLLGLRSYVALKYKTTNFEF